MDMALSFYTPAAFVRDINQFGYEPPKRTISTLFADQAEDVAPVNNQMQSGLSGFEFGASTFKKRVVTTGGNGAQLSSRINSHVSSELERITRSRVQLLAMRYAGIDSEEINARLEVLSSKLNKVLPRVDVRHIESLEDANRLVESDKEDLNRVLLELGVSI
jgi:hypothetical protein